MRAVRAVVACGTVVLLATSSACSSSSTGVARPSATVANSVAPAASLSPQASASRPGSAAPTATAVPSLQPSSAALPSVPVAGQPSAQPSATPSRSQTVAPAAPLTGLVALSCTDSTWTLTAIDPATGSITSSRIFTIPPSTKPTFPCSTANVYPYELRSDFDYGFDKLAVTLTGADGGSQVGYVSAGGGAFVAVSHAGSDFAGPNKDINPVFSRRSPDELAYEEVRPNAKTAFEISFFLATSKSKQDFATPLNSCPFTFSNMGQAQSRGCPENTDNNLQSDLWDANGTRYINLYPGIPSSYTLARYSGAELVHSSSIEIPSFEIGPCEPYLWISSSQLICSDTMLATVGAGDAKLGTKALLPQSDRENKLPAVSPDRKSMAFVSIEGQVSAIYSTNLVGSANPKKLLDLPLPDGSTPVMLISWIAGTRELP